MHYEIFDFNDATDYFAKAGAPEWADITEILDDLTPSFQPSRQNKIKGEAIFDPKAINLALLGGAETKGWSPMSLPAELSAFGVHWDSGKNRTLAEWQFSNYPFLANNVIRTEAAFQRNIPLFGEDGVEALLIVTKSCVFPSSQSTLYYEQAKAQLEVAVALEMLSLPIRLIGLGIDPGEPKFNAVWTTYRGRTSRTPVMALPCEISVTWTGKSSRYGTPKATFQRI
jgi:hypothetical protein